MSLSIRSTRGFVLLLPLLLILISCGKDEGEKKADVAVDSTAIFAEIDKAVADYNTAADSLFRVLQNIKTVEDVEHFSSTVQELNTRMSYINEITPKYGDVLLERINKNPVGPIFDSITGERERIGKLPEVASKLHEVESGGKGDSK